MRGGSVNQFAGPTVAGEEIFPRSVVPASSRRVLGAKINAWENTDLSDSSWRRRCCRGSRCSLRRPGARRP